MDTNFLQISHIPIGGRKGTWHGMLSGWCGYGQDIHSYVWVQWPGMAWTQTTKFVVLTNKKFILSNDSLNPRSLAARAVRDVGHNIYDLHEAISVL